MKSLGKDAQLLGFLLTRIGTLGVTRLLKLVYLADLESRRLRGRPMSSLRFYFHRHGPFDPAFYRAVEELQRDDLIAETVVSYPNGTQERQIAVLQDVPLELDPVDRHILANVCSAYGRLPLDELLSQVYDSPPMRGLERGAALPMDTVNNEGQKEIGFDIESLIAAQQEAENGNYVTGTDFFDGLRAKIATRR